MGLWETDADNVVACLQKWKPTGCSTEAEYETALYAFLNAEFPKEVFVRQHVHSKTRADLYVEFINGAKVAIELKANLTDRNEHHRVIG